MLMLIISCDSLWSFCVEANLVLIVYKFLSGSEYVHDFFLLYDHICIAVGDQIIKERNVFPITGLVPPNVFPCHRSGIGFASTYGVVIL
jgi:hypothetical protein